LICTCATHLLVRGGRQGEYKAAKSLLNAGRHPAFIGRDVLVRNARNGGLFFAQHDGVDIAVALVNPRVSTLLVLNVHPDHRSHGLGRAFLEFVRPNFARVVENAVPWFEKNGYIAIGDMKQGRTLRTQIMVRGELPALAGRIQRLL